MKRILSMVSALLALVLLTAAFIACDKDVATQPGGEVPGGEAPSGETPGTPDAGGQTPAPVTYTITFESKGGSAVAPLTGVAGASLTAPTAPTREGYLFSGWYESADGGVTLADTAFTFGYMPAKNFTLYARWEAVTEAGKTYTVKNGAADVHLLWGDDKDERLDEMETDEDTIKAGYTAATATFDSEGKMTLNFGYGAGGVISAYYTLAEDGRVRLYPTAEDAANGTNEQTAGDGVIYTLSADRLHLTVRFVISAESVVNKSVLEIVMTAK